MTLGTGLGGALMNFRRTRKVHGPTNRAAMMEETIQAIKALWSERKATFGRGYH